MPNALLGFSIALNIGFVAATCVMLYRRGGLAYLKKRFFARNADRQLSPAEKNREDIWAAMPPRASGWIFLGDSLIDFAPLQELFPFDTASRGRSGDKIGDVAARLDEVRRHRPLGIVVWIGLNDLVALRSGEDILRDIVALVEGIKAGNPAARLVLVGIPLLSCARGEGYLESNRTALAVNRALQARFAGTETAFIDTVAMLADREGNLRSELSLDGTHLNGAGYLAWRDMLLPHLAV